MVVGRFTATGPDPIGAVCKVGGLLVHAEKGGLAALRRHRDFMELSEVRQELIDAAS